MHVISTQVNRVLTAQKGGETMDMDDRKIRILRAIIDDYILTGVPVGSRTISKKYETGLSSATIRNEMSDLEELGFFGVIAGLGLEQSFGHQCGVDHADHMGTRVAVGGADRDELPQVDAIVGLYAGFLVEFAGCGFVNRFPAGFQKTSGDGPIILVGMIAALDQKDIELVVIVHREDDDIGCDGRPLVF